MGSRATYGYALVAAVFVALTRAQSTDDCAAALAGEGAAAWASSLTTKQLGELVRRGDLACAARAGALVDARGAATLQTEADMALRGAEQQAARVRAAVVASESGGGAAAAAAALPGELHTIVPAFEWAQSASHAFLRVKWAHKIDAPATLDVAEPRVAATNASLELVGSSRSKGFRYRLAFAPFADVVPGQCAFEAGAVGRGTLTLKKRTRARWPRLVRDEAEASKLPMHTWWDRQEQYRDELATLEAGAAAAPGAAGAEVAAPPPGADARGAAPAAPSAPRRWAAAALARLGVDAAPRLAELRGAAANLADGWRGDAKAFAARQVDRALDRARANATARLDALDAEEKARKRAVTDETKAAIAAVERDLDATLAAGGAPAAAEL